MANGSLWPEASSFTPIPGLVRSDGETHVIFLSSNGISFLEGNNDPWYRGNVRSGSAELTGQNAEGEISVYQSEEAASPMGCVEQTQFCNAMGQCGDLASYWDALDSASLVIAGTTEGVWDAPPLKLSANLSRFSWFANILTVGIDLITLVEVLGSSSLISQQRLMQSYMGPLPDNQWQLDISHWWGTILASRQAAFVSTATGPNDPSLLPYTAPPNDTYTKRLCANQVR